MSKTGIPSDLVCEQEITVIVPLVVAALRERGYQVDTLRTDFNVWENLKRLKGSFDLAFNLAEAFGGGNTNEAVVPAMLEALEIPFTGAISSNMLFTRDKQKTNLFLKSLGIPVPSHQMFRRADEPFDPLLAFPLIVKPVRQEASIGIYFDNVVTSENILRQKIADTLKLYKEPALVEEFIDGRELSVGIIGNHPALHVFPALEFLFTDARSPLQRIRSYEYKWGGKIEQMVRASLTGDVEKQLAEFSLRAFLACDCQDYARFDYRLSPNRGIFLLEVNYNPGIGPNTHGLNNTLTKMASFDNLSFEDFIEKIICTAAQRCGLS
jgi:D-alanine-D-alanine ligase